RHLFLTIPGSARLWLPHDRDCPRPNLEKVACRGLPPAAVPASSPLVLLPLRSRQQALAQTRYPNSLGKCPNQTRSGLARYISSGMVSTRGINSLSSRSPTPCPRSFASHHFQQGCFARFHRCRMNLQRRPIENSDVCVGCHSDNSKPGKFPQKLVAQRRTSLRFIQRYQQKIWFCLGHKRRDVILVLCFPHDVDSLLLR